MPSLVPGYAYDIFISYRQNDNRSGWVTEFVKNLQEELSATIKEPVSVYFDINPHDGLLETHNVDKSLEGKLKCLIFIPIISQTYCDQKSFAWQHEFVAFNKWAKDDQFGRDIKLGNGNVASRILPVKIHDLDPADNARLESETGGALRAIEFIFRSTGVNRPLNAHEEHSYDNLKKTFYRDQVNKVATAIKEIISSFIDPVPTENTQSSADKKYSSLLDTGRFGPSLTKKTALVIIALLIITIGIVILRSIISNGEPLVLLMDSAHPARVYDDETRRAGATNADVLSDILHDLPIRRQRETISPSWHRHEEMLKFNPDLIVIHYSGFHQEKAEGPRLKLRSLIEYFVDSKTKFLIYSREDEEVLREAVDNLLKDLYKDQSDLKGRIEVFGLFDYGDPSWRDPIVVNMFKLRVKKILDFK